MRICLTLKRFLLSSCVCRQWRRGGGGEVVGSQAEPAALELPVHRDDAIAMGSEGSAGK
jgi:hypothetical protein